MKHPRAAIITAATTGLLLAGAGSAVAAFAQARSYTLRRRSVLMARPEFSNQPGLRILHLSDFHAMASNKKLLRFTRELASIDPDLVVFTGDFIAQNEAILGLLSALEVFRGIPGVFVYGSNDYFAPKLRNPLSYLFRNSNEDKPQDTAALASRKLDTEDLTAGLLDLGFIDLNNARTKIRVRGFEIDLIGVDDPHIDRDIYPVVCETVKDAPLAKESSGPSLRIGVTHAPYSRVLDAMTAEGCDLIFAGHTHGGQVCLPGNTALVTNCDLPTHLASGMFAWPDSGAQAIKHNDAVMLDADGALAPSVNSDRMAQHDRTARTWVQVSAGLGTTPFVPLRTWCAPEAIQVDVINF